jgi:hypothetical protein
MRKEREATEKAKEDFHWWFLRRIAYEDLHRLLGQEICLVDINVPTLYKDELYKVGLVTRTVTGVSAHPDHFTLHFRNETRSFTQGLWFSKARNIVLPYAQITKDSTYRLVDYSELSELKVGDPIRFRSCANGYKAPRYITKPENVALYYITCISAALGSRNEIVITQNNGMRIGLVPKCWTSPDSAVLPYVPYTEKERIEEVLGTGVETSKHPMSISIEDICGNKPSAMGLSFEGICGHEPTTKEKVMSVMKDLGNIFVEGVKIHSSGDVARKIVEVVQGQLKETYPKMLSDNDLGKAIAPVLIPALVYAVSKNYGDGNTTMQKAAQVSEYALLGASKDLVEYANKLLPLFSSIAALSTLLETKDA